MLDIQERTFIMGILNVTPDSFSDGGQYSDINRAVAHALQMQEDGADIIDIGGESTRPGSAPTLEEDEKQRVVPVIQKLAEKLKIPISIDTYKSDVAKEALDAGAKIVNDISGLRFDKKMAHVISETGAGVVIMHIQGTPRHMQMNPHYQNLLAEISDYLHESIKIAVAAGIKKEQIVIDPGIGFGKRLNENFEIIRELSWFKKHGLAILAGPSRKSFIGSTLNLPVEERLEGTLAATTACILHGANIVRVHDVKQVKRACLITDKIIGKS